MDSLCKGVSKSDALTRMILNNVLEILSSGLEIIKLEYSLKLKIKRNDWLPIIVLYFEFENELNFYNLKAWHVNFLLPGVVCRYFFQRVWTCIRPDRTASLIWIQNVFHSDRFP